MLLRRALRRRLVRVSAGTEVLRRVLRKQGVCVTEGAWKVPEIHPFAEYDPLCVHPKF